MNNRILYCLKNARSYAILAQSLRSEYYRSQALKSLTLALKLKEEYNNDSTNTYNVIYLTKECAW